MSALIMQVTLMGNDMKPLPGQVAALERRQEELGERTAVIRSDLDNFKNDTKDDISELRRKTFYNGGLN